MNTTTSRRAVLAGAAALPALATPALASACSTVDPIFAAIAHARAMEDAFDAACAAADDRGEKVEIPSTCEAREALARTVPTTLQGLAALTKFVSDVTYDADVLYFEDEDMLDFIHSLVAATKALAVASP